MTQHIVRRRLLWLAAGSALAAARTARAQLTGPQAPIQTLDDALLQIMHAGAKTPFGERARIAGPAIQAAFDLPQILRISVGARWSSFSMPQQLELMEVFRRYTVASYVANFSGFSGEKFDIAPQTRAAGGDQIVTTRIVPPTGDPTRIDYVMRQSGGSWKVVDVLLDGTISRVAVQRSDFRALLGGGDATALIASLRAKTAALEGGGSQ
jgi:phospholipid transport system substrate-binding protein